MKNFTAIPTEDLILDKKYILGLRFREPGNDRAIGTFCGYYRTHPWQPLFRLDEEYRRIGWPEQYGEDRIYLKDDNNTEEDTYLHQDSSVEPIALHDLRRKKLRQDVRSILTSD